MAVTVSTVAIWFVWAALIYFVCLSGYSVRFVARSMSRRKRFAAFDCLYELLLRRGLNGAHIAFTDRKTERFVRFRKYIHEAGIYGIELTFPTTGWGQEFLPRLEAYCAENGLNCALAPAGAPGESQHLLVDCRKDAGKAHQLARKIWTDFFGLSEDSVCKRESENLLDYDDLVDGPDYSRLSPERIREIRNSEFARIESDARGGTVALHLSEYLLILLIIWLVSAFGLPISTLNSIGALPDWSIGYASMVVGGSHASLVFFLLFVFASGEMFRLIRRMGRFDRPYEWHEKVARVSLRIVVALLPISVVLVWLGA